MNNFPHLFWVFSHSYLAISSGIFEPLRPFHLASAMIGLS